MNSISFITPILPSKQDYFDETIDNMIETRDTLDKFGWLSEWIISVDGPEEVIVRYDRDNIKVIHSEKQEGVSFARNRALEAASNDYIFPIDADDLIDSNGLIRLLTRVEKEEYPWFVHNRSLIDQGDSAYMISEEKVWRPGEIQENWVSPMHFHANSIVMRREIVEEINGWPLIDANEDLALLLFLNTEHAGLALPISVVKYRIWDNQTIADPEYKKNKAAAFEFIETEVNRLRKTKGLEPIKRPVWTNTSAYRKD